MQSPHLRARSPGEILDAAFQLLRAHFLPVALASAVFLVPAVLFVGLAPSLAPALAPLANIIDRLLSLAAAAVVAVVVSDIYTGKEADVGRSMRAVGGRFFSVWGAAIIQGLALIVGLLLLVVPAFIFFAWTFAMPAIVMIEGASASQSLDRSRALAKGYVPHILATVGVAWLIFWIGLLGTGFAVGVVDEVLGVGGEFVNLISGMVVCLLYPFVGVVTTLLYYDLRIRQEGFDLQLIAERMGEPEIAGPPALA
jgi:hypothetical protein